MLAWVRLLCFRQTAILRFIKGLLYYAIPLPVFVLWRRNCKKQALNLGMLDCYQYKTDRAVFIGLTSDVCKMMESPVHAVTVASKMDPSISSSSLILHHITRSHLMKKGLKWYKTTNQCSVRLCKVLGCWDLGFQVLWLVIVVRSQRKFIPGQGQLVVQGQFCPRTPLVTYSVTFSEIAIAR
jgi:hypothetical protein